MTQADIKKIIDGLDVYDQVKEQLHKYCNEYAHNIGGRSMGEFRAVIENLAWFYQSIVVQQEQMMSMRVDTSVLKAGNNTPISTQEAMDGLQSCVDRLEMVQTQGSATLHTHLMPFMVPKEATQTALVPGKVTAPHSPLVGVILDVAARVEMVTSRLDAMVRTITDTVLP